MPRPPRRSGSSRQFRAEVGRPRTTGARARPIDNRISEVPAPSGSQGSAGPEAGLVTTPPTQVGRAPGPEVGETPAAPRFRIFIIDCGWNSAAHQVLQENFGLIRELQKEDPIYVLGREKSIQFMRHHQSRIGRDPIIAVHDLSAMETGTTGFHGFRLYLGLLRTPRQALLALQSFARFLNTHRQSRNLEAEIRADLRREGLAGAIEIIMRHEAREIGA